MTAVDVVVPDGIDDPARPSGGNVYDRRLCLGLQEQGWAVREHAVPGGWPRPDAAALAVLGAVLGRISDGAVVLLDGLVASAAPEVLESEADRLRLTVLVHMPLGHRPAPGESADVRMRERRVLAAARAVVTTSAWARGRVLELYGLPADLVHVAEPAVEAAGLAPGTAEGGELLCVAAVTPDKGHDVLLDALATVRELRWRCECVGSLEIAPAFVAELRRRSHAAGLADRLRLVGPLTRAELGHCYAAGDLLVHAARAETYGMVITEALARGLPVVATAVGGVREAFGERDGGTEPGRLVEPDDAAALGAALRSWLGDAGLRARWRRAARDRRQALPAWSATASVVARVLAGTAR